MPNVSGRDVELAYQTMGEGPPILWHTGGCGDHTMWERAGYLDALPGYRHLLFDHRGHGRSGAPESLDAYSMVDHIGDVLAVLDDAGASRAALVGYSLGARVGLALAAAHPARLTALVALDSVPPHGSEADALTRGEARVLAQGSRAVIRAMSDSESEPAPEWLLDHLSATAPEAFAGAYRAFATAEDFWASVPTLDVPTLFLVGVAEGDDEWESRAREAAATAPLGEVGVLRGLGHLQAFWRTDLSIPPIVEFLERRLGT